MSAFSHHKYSYMNNTISVLFRRMQSHLEYDLSQEQFIDLFIPEELREMSVRAPQLFDLPYRKTHLELKIPLGDQTVQFMLTANEINGKAAPLLPKKTIKYEAYDYETDPRFGAIRKYLQEYADLSRKFAVAKRVLYELNEQCGSENQMRYLYPTCLILLDHANEDKCKETADKLRAVKPPKTFPFLPEWLRVGSQESANIITAASMIPDKPSVTSEVSLTVRHITRFDYHGQAIESLVY